MAPLSIDELIDEGDGPSRRNGAVRLGEMPGGAPIDIPVTVIKGIESGPVVWIMAARDGDEVHASLAAMEIQRRILPEDVTGALVVIPIANVPGFGVLSREHPLAPTFLEQQMDDAFFELLSAQGGFFVDLHSAGVPSDTVDWTLYVDRDDVAETMARAYGSPFAYGHRMGGGEGPDPGLLDGALFVRLSRAGLPSILVEAGGGLPPAQATVERVVSGVINVLRQLHAMSGPVEPPTNEQRVLRGFRIVTSSRGGLFTDGVRLGDEVRAGGLLARVIDPYGVVVEEIRAPVSGIILTVPVNPAAGTGTWAFEIGW